MKWLSKDYNGNTIIESSGEIGFKELNKDEN